jgi:cytochrome c553
MRVLLTVLTLSLLFGCGEKSEPAKVAESAAPAGPVAPAAAPPVDNAAPAMNIGKLKYAGICLGCHGRDGQGQGPFPKLAGRPAADLATMLKDYRAGKTRGSQSATMMPFAKSLTDAEIDAITGYLAAQ